MLTFLVEAPAEAVEDVAVDAEVVGNVASALQGQRVMLLPLLLLLRREEEASEKGEKSVEVVDAEALDLG